MAYRTEKQVLRLQMALGALCVLGVACNPQSFKVSIQLKPASWFVESFQQPESAVGGKVDVLFVADTSGSMATYRLEVVNKISNFLGALPDSVDYRFAVSPAHSSLSPWSGQFFSRDGTPKVLSSKEHSRSEIENALRDSMLYMPENARSWHQGEFMFQQTLRFFEDSNFRARKSEGFFREDASLVIFLISDEADICDQQSAGALTSTELASRELLCPPGAISAQQVRARVEEAKAGRPVFFVSVANDEPGQQTFMNGNSEYGFGLVELGKGSLGASIDISGGDYSDELKRAGKSVAESFSLMRDLMLIRKVSDPESIIVRVDGVEVRWSFDLNNNRILLEEPGVFGSVIEIRYQSRS